MYNNINESFLLIIINIFCYFYLYFSLMQGDFNIIFIYFIILFIGYFIIGYKIFFYNFFILLFHFLQKKFTLKEGINDNDNDNDNETESVTSEQQDWLDDNPKAGEDLSKENKVTCEELEEDECRDIARKDDD